ncbi:hypothetical protein DID96_29585 [Burkholderia sp. Bp8963]|uniref:hypothetical protein n=1 Tax=Burkholderia sp. Bp8963 TaxID=2184547 RepID=UPI000F5B130A|nr:hypothetical protein [Burkholderia sp. Bp8963]RQS63551.1 hypothetical protein DID96_29585 [Burkholderia sp. Bp8963]
MFTPADEHSHLHAANDHLRVAVYLISAQEDRIARHRAAGLDTQLAEDLLSTMHAILRSFILHRLIIGKTVEREHGLLCRSTNGSHIAT